MHFTKFLIVLEEKLYRVKNVGRKTMAEVRKGI